MYGVNIVFNRARALMEMFRAFNNFQIVKRLHSFLRHERFGKPTVVYGVWGIKLALP